MNILILEDDANDVEFVKRELRKSEFSCHVKHVETQEDFLDALARHRPDVILSDHGLPTFNGFEALALARQHCPEVPFIFVTGLMGEEKEIDTFESGGIEYVLKSQLSRLVPAVRRAVREARERAGHQEREQSLRESDQRFRALLDGVRDYAVCMLDASGRISTWNTGAEAIMGYAADEILGEHFACFFPPDALAYRAPDQALEWAALQGRHETECTLLRKGGVPFWATVVLSVLQDDDDSLRGFALVMHDITARKQAEAERDQLVQELQNTLNSLKILSGVLPICASCKKVRDYHGHWHALEAFLAEHSEATLTHEICHDCARQIRLEA
ncbi:MAG: PAS domain S-box protein [Verrucomicrobiota bacterium]